MSNCWIIAGHNGAGKTTFFAGIPASSRPLLSLLIFEQQGEQRKVIHDHFYQHLLNKAGL